ncbi:MAG: tetratricopeptide repeat protein [Verrucomicrobiota bacterium]|nr:tetratricopeptide repeat protein [Verrucomicrobiota bacterium]
MSIIRTLPRVFILVTAFNSLTAKCQELEPLIPGTNITEEATNNASAPRAELISPVPKAEPIQIDKTVPRAEPVNPPLKPPKIEKHTPIAEKANNLLEYANYVYSQKQWELAISYYQKYLEIQPSANESASAWYRLGESLLKQKDVSGAEKAYLKIIENFSSSEYLNAASYRVGSIYYSNDQYKEASTFFNTAKKTATKKNIQLSAAYYHARCLREIKENKAALAAYEELCTIQNENPYLEAALLTIARIYSELEKNEKSIQAFLSLDKITTREDIRSEALVKSGLMSSSIGKEDQAKEYLTKALNLQGGDEWKPDAQFHLIKTYYSEKNYEQVISTYSKGAYPMSETIRPKMLLMVGNSFRQLQRHRDAVSVYIMLREHYPASKEASESEYRKLLSLFNLRSRSIPKYVDNFVEWQTPRDSNHKNIDMALLLKAEHYFNKKQYAESGNSYDEIRISNIPNNLRGSTLYKRGWAHTESKNYRKSINAFSDFISTYPDEARVPNALAKRALNYRAIEDYTSALQDLNLIITNHPDSESTELAYQQVALIKGQQQDYAGMIKNYQNLIEKFPDSSAKSEAYFWIGWGQFELQNFKESSTALRRARELNRSIYNDRATLRIILAEYSQQKVEAVQKEVETLSQRIHKITIPPQIYLWLGINLFDSGDYQASSNYLSVACNPQEPETTQAVIWKYLGQAHLFTGKYKEAITAFDYYLETNQPSNNRARVLHDKSAALLALKNFDEAEITVENGLTLQPKSRTYGMLCLLWGEIALQQQEYEKAIQRLVKPTYAIEDEKVTPTALLKSAFAHEKMNQKDKASELRNKLKTKYPKFSPKTIIPGISDSTATASTLD